MNRFLDSARIALRSAQVLRDLGDTKGALSRAYYAAFDAVRAALSTVPGLDVHAIKTHRGLEQLFNLHFVKTSLLARDIAEEFAALMELRWVADYGAEPPPLSEADAGIAGATTLVAAIEAFLRSTPSETP